MSCRERVRCEDCGRFRKSDLVHSRYCKRPSGNDGLPLVPLKHLRTSKFFNEDVGVLVAERREDVCVKIVEDNAEIPWNPPSRCPTAEMKGVETFEESAPDGVNRHLMLPRRKSTRPFAVI